MNVSSYTLHVIHNLCMWYVYTIIHFYQCTHAVVLYWVFDYTGDTGICRTHTTYMQGGMANLFFHPGKCVTFLKLMHCIVHVHVYRSKLSNYRALIKPREGSHGRVGSADGDHDSYHVQGCVFLPMYSSYICLCMLISNLWHMLYCRLHVRAVGIALYYIIVCFYLYGTLSIFLAMIAKSLVTVTWYTKRVQSCNTYILCMLLTIVTHHTYMHTAIVLTIWNQPHMEILVKIPPQIPPVWQSLCHPTFLGSLFQISYALMALLSNKPTTFFWSVQVI